MEKCQKASWNNIGWIELNINWTSVGKDSKYKIAIIGKDGRV